MMLREYKPGVHGFYVWHPPKNQAQWKGLCTEETAVGGNQIRSEIRNEIAEVPGREKSHITNKVTWLIVATAQLACFPASASEDFAPVPRADTISNAPGSSSTSSPCVDVHSIAGAWNSDLGPVEIKIDSVATDGRVRLSGSWTQGEKKGVITGGIFDGQTMVLDYYLPWNQQYGRWTLQKSEGFKFNGIKEQPIGTSRGAWNMSRPCGINKPAAAIQLGSQPAVPN